MKRLFFHRMEESTNVTPVHKKIDKQLLKKRSANISIANLRQSSVEVTIQLYLEFFMQKYLITPNQSSFRKGDLCTKQLMSITHKR